MSRWWPERASVCIAPRKGQDALACFELELDACTLPRRSRLTCVMGGPQVRWRIVPWSDALASPHQRHVLAASCFQEAFGPAARAWAVRNHEPRFGAAGLACAVDAALPGQLEAAALQRGLRLHSLQPSLVHAFNLLRPQLSGDMFWFVWEEAAVTTLLLWCKGEPLHLKVVPTAPKELATLLDREWFLAALDAPRCPVYLARAQGTRLFGAAGKGWRIVELPLSLPARRSADAVVDAVVGEIRVAA